MHKELWNPWGDGVQSSTWHARGVVFPQLMARVRQEVGKAQEYGCKTLGFPVQKVIKWVEKEAVQLCAGRICFFYWCWRRGNTTWGLAKPSPSCSKARGLPSPVLTTIRLGCQQAWRKIQMVCSMLPQDRASVQFCGYMDNIMDVSGEKRVKLLVTQE